MIGWIWLVFWLVGSKIGTKMGWRNPFELKLGSLALDLKIAVQREVLIQSNPA